MNKIESLNKVFASTYVLYNKTQQIHWNLKNSRFLLYHSFFEEHYKNYQENLDLLAELLVISSGSVLGDLDNIIKSSIISNKVESFSDINIILDSLIKDHEDIIKLIEKAYSEAGDILIEDIYTSRMAFHKKALWMMQASLVK